jgi:hypothetical protein
MNVTRSLCALGLLWVATGWTTPALAVSAARVEFVAGRVVAVDVQGRERVLTRGTEVAERDTVDTGSGRVQLRFSDGAYVSLQPQSKFRIDAYRFDGKTDGNERGFFSLLQGGLRTITGLVGRSNKKNYQVTTAVATIGIRGTEYTIQYGNSVSGSVGKGEIAVCNGGGCLDVKNGESYFVKQADLAPVMSTRKSDLPPPTPGDPPGGRFETANNSNDSPNAGGFVSGDQVTSTGSLAGLQLSGTQSLALGVTVNVVCRSACSPAFDLLGSDVVTFNDNGSVASVNAGKDPLTNVTAFGNTGLIAWGVGLDKLGQAFHYVTGPPAMYSDLSSLAISQPVAYFDLIAGSTPMAVNSATGAAVTGVLTGGKLEARFAVGYVNATLDIAIAGSNLTVQANNLGFYDAPGTLGFYGYGATCAETACSAEVKGFIGAGAASAGAIYRVNVSGTTLPGPVIGSAAFANTSPSAQ